MNKLYKEYNIIALISLSGLLFFSVLLSFAGFRSFIISLTECLLVHRPLNHNKWFVVLQKTRDYFMVFAVMMTAFHLFTCWFVFRTHDSFINLLRCTACLMVFFLHVSIFTASRGVPVFTNVFIKALRTPAWGGVYIFFVLSGYLAGKGFSDGRYTFDKTGICLYYKNRVLKVLFPTFFFIFLCCVFVYPTFIKEHPKVLIKFLTCTYNGGPGVDGIGATWYVFTLLPLYFLAPFLFRTAARISKKTLLFCSVAAVTFSVGFLYRLIACKIGLNWYSCIYTFWGANIDLFFGGILLSQVNVSNLKSDTRVFLKHISLFLLLLFILVNSLLYEKYFFYQVFCPSIYLGLCGFCLVCYGDEKRVFIYESKFEKLLAFFSSIAFEFYLFHSLVLHTILAAFKDKNVYLLHFELLAVSGVISCICATGFSRIFKRR